MSVPRLKRKRYADDGPNRVDDMLKLGAFPTTWALPDLARREASPLLGAAHHRSPLSRAWARKGPLESAPARDGVDMYGIMSSHPAACLAAADAFGGKHAEVKLYIVGITLRAAGSFGPLQPGPMGKYAKEIIKASPVTYVKDAKLRGSVFDAGDTSGRVSSVDSAFGVDHNEPLEALALVRKGKGLAPG
ncbi:hypothetical protein BUE80_DR010801 [Diplocarpon rosae]|nr:hypothetical protein BUE80_DR010801 [Diplocarpon rosae]